MLMLLMLGTLALTLNVQPASPATITVPDNYSTIQRARYESPASAAGTTDANGRNWCLLFNDADYGMNDSVNVSYSQMFDMHQLTIEAWVKPLCDIIGSQSSNASETGTLMGHSPQSSNAGWWTGFLYSTGNLCLQLGNSTLGSYVQFLTTRDKWYNDSWYHVAVTFNPDLADGNVRFYVNGTLDSQSDYQGNIRYAEASPVQIGACYGAEQYAGFIDDVRIWNVSLSQSEVQHTMNRVLDYVEMMNSSLAGYWRFDEGGANGVQLTTKDYSLYHNVGTLVFAHDWPVWALPAAPITPPGDLDGDFQVSLQDLVRFANAYGSKPGDPKWNPNADIDGNGRVGLADLVIFAQYYNHYYY